MSDPPAQPRRRRCPTCRRLFEATHPLAQPYRPFCSRRCQLIDLGKWLNEEYVIHTPLGDAAGGLPLEPPPSGPE